MDLGLSGKVVLITGAAGGIGLTGAQCFAAEGALMMRADHDAGPLVEATPPGPVATGPIEALTPEQLKRVTDLPLFLSSSRSSCITGEVVNVNGGLRMD